jgi:hypothetical protein
MCTSTRLEGNENGILFSLKLFNAHLFNTDFRSISVRHRYLMTRLSLQVFYLWRLVSSTAPPLMLWWSNLEILLFGPLHRSSPFIGELPCQAIQTEHGPYITERTQKAVYIVRCLWCAHRNPVGYWEHQTVFASYSTVPGGLPFSSSKKECWLLKWALTICCLDYLLHWMYH